MSQNRIRWTAVVVFAVALGVLWFTRGYHADKEALKYIGCAKDLLRGDAHDLVGSYKAYAAYVLFLVPFVACGALWAAVIAQALLAVLAAFALARVIERLSGRTGDGTIAVVMLLLCYPFQEWVLALYTESFFASIAVLFLERATRPGRMHWSTFALGLILLFARPNGVLFVLPALFWRSPMMDRAGAWSRPVLCAVVLGLVLLLPGVARHQLGTIVEGHVICGFPERPAALEHFHGRNILDAQVALFDEPDYALGLFARRATSLFTLTRPYYSTGHNALLLPFYALYLFAILGWWSVRAASRSGLWPAILLLNAALIGFTYDEWNGRFLVPLWPIIVGFAAIGVGRVLQRPLHTPALAPGLP